MSLDFLNPFLKAATSVLASEVGAHVDRGTVTLANTGRTPHDVTVLLSVVGDIQGIVLYSMRSEEHTSELQSHSFISYAVFCLKKKITTYVVTILVNENSYAHRI